jgi:hypothetical protein
MALIVTAFAPGSTAQFTHQHQGSRPGSMVQREQRRKFADRLISEVARPGWWGTADDSGGK